MILVLGLWVQDHGFMAQGSRVQGIRLRRQDLGFRVCLLLIVLRGSGGE